MPTLQIRGEGLPIEGPPRKSTAFTIGDLTAIVFSENDPPAAVLVVQNRGAKPLDDIRCVVRMGSGLRRVVRGDSLLLKPANQFNKYKFVVEDLAAGASKRFVFPFSIAGENDRNVVFAIQTRTYRHSAGIGVSTKIIAPIPPIDDKWGSLSGRIVYGGDVPALRKISIDQHREKFGSHIFDESLHVNENDKGISNAVIGLFVPINGKMPKVHPGFKELPTAFLQIANGQFVPRISLLRSNQSLTIWNRDEFAHNPKIDSLRNLPLNPLLESDDLFECRFAKAEPIPVPVSGSIHSWLMGRIVVSDHPYVAKTDPNGRFEIRNIPPGHHEFRVWHERCGYVDEVIVKKIPKKWPKGIFPIKIEKGKNTIGEIIASADQFK